MGGKDEFDDGKLGYEDAVTAVMKTSRNAGEKTNTKLRT